MTAAVKPRDQAAELAAAACPSSLAYYGQMVAAIKHSTCQNWPLKWCINLRTAQPIALRCRRNTCSYCLPRNARIRALAITSSAPERMIRLSLVAPMGDPDPLETARIRIKRTREALSDKGVEAGEWSWTLEENPNENGYHAHAVQHGPYVPQDALQTACRRAGGGFPDVRYIRRTPGQVSRYGLKGFGADGYGMKRFRAPGDAHRALAINHGRLEHHTREFFRLDGTTAAVKEVERETLARLFPAASANYLVCTPHEARRYYTPTGIVALSRLATTHPGIVPIADVF